MNRKKKPPIYGNSQGAKSGELNSNSKNKRSPEKKYIKSGELFDDRNDRSSQIYSQDLRPTQIKSARIKSFPRTIAKLSILGVIVYQLLVNTQIGKDLTVRISQQMANTQKKVNTTASELDPKTRGEKRKKIAEDRMEDAWKRAGGKAEKND